MVDVSGELSVALGLAFLALPLYFGVKEGFNRTGTQRGAVLGDAALHLGTSGAEKERRPMGFKIGDVVILKSGGVKMTVVKTGLPDDSVRCAFQMSGQSGSGLYLTVLAAGALELYVEHAENEAVREHMARMRS